MSKQQKALEDELVSIYRKRNAEFEKIHDTIRAFKPEGAHGNLHVRIENVLTETDTGLPCANPHVPFMWAIRLFGNINGKTGAGLFWLDAKKKETLLSAGKAFVELSEKTEKLLSECEKRYPGIKHEQHALLSMRAR